MGGVDDCIVGFGIVVGSGGTGGVDVFVGRGGGPPAALTAREGGPLGGGGVAEATLVGASPFLFIHLPSSLS